MQSNQNYFFELQNLLTQITNHVNQINGIIMQMNNIMNLINNPMMNQMNMNMNLMNNNMNFGNQINYNNNINDFLIKVNEENIDLNKKMDLMNIIFIGDDEQKNNATVTVTISPNQTINELINLYLERIGMPNLINNYRNKFKFIIHGTSLVNYKEKKVGEFLRDGSRVTVLERYF